MITESGAHQVEFRWRANHDLDAYAHSGLEDRDLDILRRVVLPVGRAPLTSDGPSHSVVHLALPKGLGSAAGRPVGVIIVRRHSGETGADGEAPGGRLGLATRAIIVPGINRAIPVALGLAQRGLSSPQLGEMEQPGASLPPLSTTEVDRLGEIMNQLGSLTPEVRQIPLFEAAVGMLLERTAAHMLNRRIAIEVGPDWDS